LRCRPMTGGIEAAVLMRPIAVHEGPKPLPARLRIPFWPNEIRGKMETTTQG